MSDAALIAEARERSSQAGGPDYHLLKRLADALEARQWRPIETAPQDGTLVLVYAPRPAPERWDPVVWDLPPIITTCAHHPDAGWNVDDVREVTLWCPIPPLPEDVKMNPPTHDQAAPVTDHRGTVITIMRGFPVSQRSPLMIELVPGSVRHTRNGKHLIALVKPGARGDEA